MTIGELLDTLAQDDYDNYDYDKRRKLKNTLCLIRIQARVFYADKNDVCRGALAIAETAINAEAGGLLYTCAAEKMTKYTVMFRHSGGQAACYQAEDSENLGLGRSCSKTELRAHRLQQLIDSFDLRDLNVFAAAKGNLQLEAQGDAYCRFDDVIQDIYQILQFIRLNLC